MFHRSEQAVEDNKEKQQQQGPHPESILITAIAIVLCAPQLKEKGDGIREESIEKLNYQEKKNGHYEE